MAKLKMKVAAEVFFHQLKDFGDKLAKLVDRSFKENKWMKKYLIHNTKLDLTLPRQRISTETKLTEMKMKVATEVIFN